MAYMQTNPISVNLKPWALPTPISFFEKKETKKLYNGKLRFPISVDLANG